METMTLDQYHAAIKSQGVPIDHVAMRCPMCKTLQSATDLIDAGAGVDLNAVEKYLGFSCVGRFTGAEGPRNKPDGNPCNWTLGGLFGLHEFEVVTPDGEHHPRFALASPDEAMTYMATSHAIAA